MYSLNETPLRKDDEVTCPSCRKTVFLQKDISISELGKLVRCGRCGAYVKYGNLRRVSDKAENNG